MIKTSFYSIINLLNITLFQNTPKSLEYASKLWSDMASSGSIPVRRACTFFAGLCYFIITAEATSALSASLSAQMNQLIRFQNGLSFRSR